MFSNSSSLSADKDPLVLHPLQLGVINNSAFPSLIFILQLAYVCWLSPNICVFWLCSAVGEKQPSSPEWGTWSCLPSSTGSVLCFPWDCCGMCLLNLQSKWQHLWTHGKASWIGHHRSLSSTIMLWQCSKVGSPAQPSFLAVWPWTSFLTSLGLSFIIFKMRISHST